MSSIFTYQDELPRIRSPWSTPGSATPQFGHLSTSLESTTSGVDHRTKLEPEKQDGPCEYKLHLLLRARRPFLSMTTAQNGSNAVSIRPVVAVTNLSSSGRSASETSLQRSSYQPSPQTRQARLQQLTTQLLWRLQQSSPFHSSSNAELVLPVLPEATPRLGVPDRPARLLPGLEESQGALYEIGVADDGTLVGLVEDELDESLNNLRAMAASLGCVVDELRRLAVGTCEWEEFLSESTDSTHNREQLYVAEVLVHPEAKMAPLLPPEGIDSPSKVAPLEQARSTPSHDQLRVTLTGPSAGGKSSLLGTLTTSSLDNGRGKSRLSLLKHRHEIASGITSSVAHELLGYRVQDDLVEVVNYASGDVSTWTDIHALSDRLCFVSDSPGLSRFAKSTFRALVSWQPDWAAFCLAANDGETGGTPGSEEDRPTTDPALVHLDLCLKLGLRMIVVITKMDLATKPRLRAVLGKVLTCLKSASRKPLLLSAASIPVPAFALDSADAVPDLQRVSPQESAEIDQVVATLETDSDSVTVPIVMTSAVSGAGIGKLHHLLSRLPLPTTALKAASSPLHAGKIFHVDEVFSIPPVRIYNADAESKLGAVAGMVLCGRVEAGTIHVGDQMDFGPFSVIEPSGFGTPGRSKSLTSQDLRRLSLSASTHDTHMSNMQELQSGGLSAFATVKVVSLRNLRLPVRQLSAGETGTIGIELHGNHDLGLHKARKGMVLASESWPVVAGRGIIVTFPASDFLVASPPLILGGHATAYLNSIRAAVKVVALSLVEDEIPDVPASEVFTFDSDDSGTNDQHISDRTVQITMRFVSTVEYVRAGDQALLVPTFSAAGPVTGPVSSTSGLMGFVGKVVEVLQ